MTETAEVIDVEGEEVTDMVPAVSTMPVGQVSIYRSADPERQLEEARARAKVLVEVVQEQNLAQTFGSGRKPHVNVEGWVFLASQFGLMPDIEWTRELPDGAGWEARAQLIRLADGAVLTHAESECRRNEEKGGKQRWKNANAYEIRSMAQTRATSKVCRNALSSIMVMAGFAGTPAEEMDGSAWGGEPATTPTSPDEPHCPACLAVNGELVAVTGPHDKKPYWRCTKDAKECGGHRVYKGKDYSWSGWKADFAEAKAEWFENNPEYAGVQTKMIGGRANRSDFVVEELMGTLGWEKEKAATLVKPALVFAIAEGQLDPVPILTETGHPKIAEGYAAEQGEGNTLELSDDHLRILIKNLTSDEAQIVVTAGATLASMEPDTAPF